MGKKLRDLAQEDCELEMTPMIDVTFLLLIFFMCTLKFKTLEGKLAAYLPKDVGVAPSQAEPIEKIEVRLVVLEEGTKRAPGARPGELGRPYSGASRFVYDDTRVIQYTVGTRQTTSLADVRQRLTELHRRNPERPLAIDARPGTVYADVVKAVDTVLEAGFIDITFVGAHPPLVR